MGSGCKPGRSGPMPSHQQDYPCNRVILVGWAYMPWFWDLVAMSSQIPLCLLNLVTRPFNQTIQQESVKPEPTCLAPRATAIKDQVSLRQWQHYLEPDHLEQLPKHRVVQNGDTRDNKNLPTGRGMGYLHRLQGRILPRINS